MSNGDLGVVLLSGWCEAQVVSANDNQKQLWSTRLYILTAKQYSDRVLAVGWFG